MFSEQAELERQTLETQKSIALKKKQLSAAIRRNEELRAMINFMTQVPIDSSSWV
jgi:hypothetical protein